MLRFRRLPKFYRRANTAVKAGRSAEDVLDNFLCIFLSVNSLCGLCVKNSTIIHPETYSSPHQIPVKISDLYKEPSANSAQLTADDHD